MKIAMVVSDYPPAHGGAAAAVQRLALELVSRGHTIDVLTSAIDRSVSDVASIEGTRVHRFRVVLSTVMKGPILDVQGMNARVNDVKPDVLHFHGQGHLHNDLLSWMQRDVPQVFCGHGTGWSRRPDAPWHWFVAWEVYDRALGRRLVRRARRVVALTNHEVPYWSARGIPQSRIRVIPWGIEPECFVARDGE